MLSTLVYDPQFGTQFDQEAQIVAALNHPNIVRVFDFYMPMAPVHGYGETRRWSARIIDLS